MYRNFNVEGPIAFLYLAYPKYSVDNVQKGFFEGIPDRISAWRFSLNRTSALQQNRVVYRVEQCLDSDGPKLAPDVIDGVWYLTIERGYLAYEYNRRLACANSARVDGRHMPLAVIIVVCRRHAGSSIRRLSILSTSWLTYLSSVSRSIGNQSSWLGDRKSVV